MSVSGGHWDFPMSCETGKVLTPHFLNFNGLSLDGHYFFPGHTLTGVIVGDRERDRKDGRFLLTLSNAKKLTGLLFLIQSGFRYKSIRSQHIPPEKHLRKYISLWKNQGTVREVRVNQSDQVDQSDQPINYSAIICLFVQQILESLQGLCVRCWGFSRE